MTPVPLPCFNERKRARRECRRVLMGVVWVLLSSTALAIPNLATFANRYGPAVVRIVDAEKAVVGRGFFVASDGTAVVVFTEDVSDDDQGLGATPTRAPLSIQLADGRTIPFRIALKENNVVVVHAAVSDERPPMSLVVKRTSEPNPEWVTSVFLDDNNQRVAAHGGPRRQSGTPMFDIPAPVGAPVMSSKGVVMAVVTSRPSESHVGAMDATTLAALIERAGPHQKPSIIPVATVGR